MSEIEKLSYGVSEAARALGISPWTVRAYGKPTKDGKPAKIRVTRVGSRVLIERDELLRLLREGRELKPQPSAVSA